MMFWMILLGYYIMACFWGVALGRMFGKDGYNANKDDRWMGVVVLTLLWPLTIPMCLTLRANDRALCRRKAEYGEPWIGEHYPGEDGGIVTIRTADGRVVLEGQIKAEWHERIVACVNDLVGVPTKTITNK